jgi:enamine deaminase RidA (YjgF/YER057c/UK114 family)
MSLILSTGWVLPIPPDPVGVYERGVIRGGLGFVSGHFPIVGGIVSHAGRVGAELNEAQGKEAAEIAAMNIMAQIDHLLDGDWDRFAGLLRLDGYVASAEGWTAQPRVLNAASEVFVKILGDKGRHARAAFSVTQLPLNAPIELVATFAVTV